MKKKIILLSLSSIMALSSCMEEIDPVDGCVSYDSEIRFGVSGLSVTKSIDECSSEDLEAGGFKVAVINDENSSILFNKGVTYIGGIYAVAGETYYYPSTGTISAYAVYPKTERINFKGSIATIAYTQNPDENMVVAKSVNVSRQKAAIDMEFSHPLSCVSFCIKGVDTNVDYKLKRIEVTAPDGGTYRFDTDDWGDIGSIETYSVFSSEGMLISTDEFEPVGESMSFIPGEIGIRVVWDCYDKDDGAVVGRYDQTASTVLSKGEYTTINLSLPKDDALYMTRALVFSSPTAAVLQYYINGSLGEINLEYSKDAVEWTPWNGSRITFGAGTKLYVRGKNPTGICTSLENVLRFQITGSNVRCIGDIMTLIDYDEEITTIPCDCCFYGLFASCAALIQAPSLSATTLTDRCYAYMFYNCSSLTQIPTISATTLAPYCCSNMFANCTSLTKAPILPATTLAPYCYQQMFRNCTSLVDAPILPATEIIEYCYSYMFENCTSLINAPALPSTELATYCYYNMFMNCTSLMRAPSLPATELASYCYSNMFNGCTSLTLAPELPATNLITRCYSDMFNGCISLSEAPALPALIAASYCYSSMFKGCTSLTKAPELPAIILATRCYQYMFNGCTALVSAPVLPATSLSAYCYNEMFNGCTQLNSITMLATSIPSTSLMNWVSGVSPTGTFTKAASMTTLPTGTSGIPDGWDVVSK